MEFITIYWWRIIACAVISYLLGSFSFELTEEQIEALGTVGRTTPGC